MPRTPHRRKCVPLPAGTTYRRPAAPGNRTATGWDITPEGEAISVAPLPRPQDRPVEGCDLLPPGRSAHPGACAQGGPGLDPLDPAPGQPVEGEEFEELHALEDGEAADPQPTP